MYFGYFFHSKLVTQKCSGVKQASRGRGMCVCTCVWRSEVDIGYLLWLLSMLYFGQSLTELRTHRFGCTDWPASPRGSSCPGFPHDGIIGICHYAQCFMLVLEIELWFSCLYSRHFINWPVLLVSKQIMSGLLKIEMRQFSFRKKCSCSCTILRFEIPKAWLSSISKRHLHTLHCDVWHLGVVHTHNANIQEAEVERFLWVWVSLSYRVRLCSKQ